MCYTGSVCGAGESREKKKREMRGDMSEGDEKKEREEVREGKMYSTTSPSKPTTDTVSIDL